MFTILGKSIAKRPIVSLIAWLLLFTIGILAAFTGLGQGNVFQRVKSSTSLVPNTDSDVVVQKSSAENSGESIVAIVTGASLAEAKHTLKTLSANLAEIPHVKEVLDPLKIDEEFNAQILKEKEAALAKALEEAEPSIIEAIAAAKQQQNQQLQALPENLRETVAAQIAQEVRTEITDKVKTQASKEIDAELAKLDNPAENFTPDNDRAGENGFALLVKLSPGTHHDSETEIKNTFEEYQQILREAGNTAAKVGIMSTPIISDAILSQVTADLVTGEIIGLPIALILMIFVFGGALAAGIPLGSALITIVISVSIIWALTFAANVDSFVLNILSIIGVALSIDYGLLVVSRYREIINAAFHEKLDFPLETAKEHQAELQPVIAAAVIKTVETAGRTVSFSAITIAIAISGLFMIKVPMIQMIAVGGVLVTLFAVFTAVTFVPAMISLLGCRLIKPSPLAKVPILRTIFRHLSDVSRKHGIFSKLAAWVHARPWPVLIVITAFLIVSAIPVANLQMRSNMVSYTPSDAPVSKVLQQIDQHYPSFQTPDISIYAQTNLENAEEFAAKIASLDGVERVDPPSEQDKGAMISIFSTASDPVGMEVTKLVQDLRAMNQEYDFAVGGAAAMQLDFRNALGAGAPYAAILIVLAVFVLLFLLTGSIVVPLKALIINTLSLVSSIGITIFIFQNGLFGMPVTPGLETFVVACIAAFGFGLAMDYEVFLIARIKEYWDSGMDNDTAVEYGLQQSGRIITAAAAIIIAVFIGFSFGGLLPIKETGVALAVIVFVDATLVRMLLVPALMTLMGKWNWWAPKPLLKIYEKFKIIH